jgi:hypothetical protein
LLWPALKVLEAMAVMVVDLAMEDLLEVTAADTAVDTAVDTAADTD